MNVDKCLLLIKGNKLFELGYGVVDRAKIDIIIIGNPTLKLEELGKQETESGNQVGRGGMMTGIIPRSLM